MRLTSRILALAVLIVIGVFANALSPVASADDNGCTDTCDRNVVACCQTYGQNGGCPQFCSDRYLACLSKCSGPAPVEGDQ